MLPTIKKGIINGNAPKSYQGKEVTYEDILLDGVSIHSLCGSSELTVCANPKAKLYLTKEYLFRVPKNPTKCYPIIPANWVDPIKDSGV